MQQTSNEVIYQECECCREWVNQMDLVWDLDEDMLICKKCYKERKSK